jgi:hypothetical protein
MTNKELLEKIIHTLWVTGYEICATGDDYHPSLVIRKCVSAVQRIDIENDQSEQKNNEIGDLLTSLESVSVELTKMKNTLVKISENKK